MSSFWLKLDPIPGSDIAICGREASVIADRLGVTATFNFNGVHCMVRPGDDPETMADNYHKVLLSKSTYKIATTNAR